MSLQVERKDLDHCSVELAIEVPAERVAQAIERETRRVLKQVSIPGFRPGKAPRSLAERYIDAGKVRQRAVEKLAVDSTVEAVKQQELSPYHTDLDFDPATYREGEPLQFAARITLGPHVHLSDFDDLTARRGEVEITEADVDKELQRLREALTRWEPKEGPAAEGDRIRATVVTTIEGEELPSANVDNAWLEVGTNIPAFDAGLAGASAGEEREHRFTYPEDASQEQWRGKEAVAKITVHEVRQQQLPELDDAFANQLGAESLDALRQRIREGLESQAHALAESELREGLLRQVVRGSTVHLPEPLIEERAAERLTEFVGALEARGLTLDGYLEHHEMNLAQLKTSIADDVRKGIEQSLVILTLAREMEIAVDDDAVDAALRRRAADEGLDDKQTRKLLQDDEERDRERRALTVRGVLDGLVSRANIQDESA